MSEAVFVDTGYILALVNENDQDRVEALALSERYGADLFVTTDDQILKKMPSSQALRVAPPLAALATLEHWYDHGN